jgi:hypothetical protein
MVLAITNAFAGAPPGTDAVWTGASSTSWTDAANWAPGIPGLTDDVFIRADAANPLIVTGVRTIDSLTVQAGATVTVNGGADTLVVEAGSTAGSPRSRVAGPCGSAGRDRRCAAPSRSRGHRDPHGERQRPGRG